MAVSAQEPTVSPEGPMSFYSVNVVRNLYSDHADSEQFLYALSGWQWDVDSLFQSSA